MYSVSAYYLAKIIIEVPVLSFIPILFSVMVYFKIGLTITASQFFYFYLILLLISHSAASFGYFISSIFNKEEMAIALAPIVMMPIILFGGQFANSDNIQAWISWF
jgi:ATP-binding cassette subfamily G (WHITE) protein 1